MNEWTSEWGQFVRFFYFPYKMYSTRQLDYSYLHFFFWFVATWVFLKFSTSVFFFFSLSYVLPSTIKWNSIDSSNFLRVKCAPFTTCTKESERKWEESKDYVKERERYRFFSKGKWNFEWKPTMVKSKTESRRVETMKTTMKMKTMKQKPQRKPTRNSWAIQVQRMLEIFILPGNEIDHLFDCDW